MKPLLIILSGMTLLLLAACLRRESACPQASGTRQYLQTPPQALSSPTPAQPPAPVEMVIGGRTIAVDRVIEGPLCNDTWSGTVYVDCDVQVYPWEEEPTFLKDCNLVITPGTVVYVAYHNDEAYYNGCSCHTGEIAGP